ncbi:MAG: ABC transporter permease [Candidatus Limnocylindrales bacterium]
MIKYAVRRTLQAIPVLIGISLVIYAILLIAPGGPEARFAQNPRITQSQIAAFRHRWGLDQPIPIQYCRWLGACGDKPFLINALPGGTIELAGLRIELPGGDNGVLHGDFGFSAVDGRPVTAIIGERLPATLILAGTAWIIWVVIAFISGVYAAVKRYSLFDSALTIFNYIGFSFPTFWLGIMLITVFAGTLHLLPAGGMWTTRTVPPFGTAEYWTFFGAQPLTALADLGRHLILPAFTLVVVSIAYDSRFVRSSMLEALNQDYIRTARAKGVSERGVIFRHALRNALLPVITNLGLEIPFLFTGAFVTETIFSWPGMGYQFIQSTANFDYPVLMGLLSVTALVTVFANLAADLTYAVVDPRVKYD